METTIELPRINAMSLLAIINDAFQWRKRPAQFAELVKLSEDELSELSAITCLEWTEVTAEIWEKNFDVISILSPEAYCYYLPGVMKASVEDGYSNLVVVSNVIAELDRSPTPEWWDDFFLSHWPKFTVPEYKAIQEWIFWLSSLENSPYTDDSLDRALETINLLIKRAQ